MSFISIQASRWQKGISETNLHDWIGKEVNNVKEID